MAEQHSAHPIGLQLSRDQALVLFELLMRFEETDRLSLTNNAEFIALNALSGELQSKLTEPFDAAYKTLLKEATTRLEAGFEGRAPGIEP
jgi:hypothetical protein